jgi:hypothetical protein
MSDPKADGLVACSINYKKGGERWISGSNPLPSPRTISANAASLEDQTAASPQSPWVFDDRVLVPLHEGHIRVPLLQVHHRRGCAIGCRLLICLARRHQQQA